MVTTFAISLAIVILVVGLLALSAPLLDWRSQDNNVDDATLETEKKRREVQDLKYGWLRTLGTALLTAFVAVGGWYVQAKSSADESHRQQTVHDTDERSRNQQAATETYFRFLSDLGDPSATKRITADEYLEQTYVTLKREQSRIGVTDIDGPTRDLRLRQIVQALVYRFSTENDLAVQEEIRLTLQRLGPDVLGPSIAANRRVEFLFANQLGTVMAQRLFRRLPKSQIDRIQRPGISPDDLPVDYAILREETQALSYSNFARAVALRYTPGNRLVSRRSTYGADQLLPNVFRRSARDSIRSNLLYAPREISASEAKLQDLASEVDATGSLVAYLLRHSGVSAHADLRGMLIPYVDLSYLDLTGAELQNTIILADLTNARLDFAHMKNAVVWNAASTDSASFQAADVSNAILTDESGEIAFGKPGALKGANTVDAYYMDRNTGEAGAFLGADAENPRVHFKIATMQHAECMRLARLRKEPCPWVSPTPNPFFGR
ncbi:MAG TPA: hypothetical protein VK669_09505 [Candidatus Limnocylindrales bacterium]|nr:hypothetical protein [Candidatus Limnocylindrales bacterium]